MSSDRCCTHYICDCHAQRLRMFKRQLDAVEALIEHARLISTGDRMTIYVADLEDALELANRERPHKVGLSDGEGLR